MKELKLTKTDRLIVNAATKDTSRGVLHCVHIKKGKIEAANGFILVERKIDYDGEDTLLDISDIAKHKDSRESINTILKVEGNFPITEALYPTEKPVFRIALGRSQLLSMLKCLNKNEEIIKFQFYGDKKAVKFETADDEVTGLIMPVYVDWDK